MNKHYLFLALYVLTFACKQHRKNEDGHTIFRMENFKKKVNLSGKSLDLMNLTMPSKIRVIPEFNLLVILEMDEGEYFAKAYTLDSLKFIKSFVKNGDRDNEQTSAATIQHIRNEKFIYISDFNKKRIFVYSIDSLLSPVSMSLPVASVRINTRFLREPLVLGENKIIDLRSNYRNEPVALLNSYNMKGEPISFQGQFPASASDFDEYQLTDVFTGGLNLSEDGSKLIFAYYNTDYIDLYDTSNNLKKRIQGPDLFEPEYTSKSVGKFTMTIPKKDARFAYNSLARMNENEIFILYNGKEAKTNEYHVNKLFKFDGSLTPDVLYELNVPIFSFDIDWTNRKLYGLTHKNKNKIFVFDL